jgi:hypothetical protein
MHSRNIRVLVFGLGCIVAETTLLSSPSALSQSVQPNSGAASATQNPKAGKKTEFAVGDMGELRDEDGVHLGFTHFKASDGVGLMVLYEDFDNTAKAEEYFEKRLAKAAKVIERGNKVNGVGKVVGARAQILLRLDPPKTIPAVLWTDGLKFHEIYSSSLKDILELEKVYRY